MKRILLLLILMIPAALISAEVADNETGRAIVRIFPQLKEGYIDLNHNNKMDRLDDMDELVPETLSKDGVLQVQEIMDFISENYAYLLIDELKALQGAFGNADGTFPQLLSLNYERTIAGLVEKKEALGADGLYLSPSARKEAEERMSFLVGTMVSSFKKEQASDERDYEKARDELLTMIEQGYPVPGTLNEEDRGMLVSAFILTTVNEKESNPNRVKAAVATLGKIGDPFSVSYIINLMDDQRYRSVCIKALGDIGNDKAESVLTGIASGSEADENRADAFGALGKLGGSDSLDLMTSLAEKESGLSGIEHYALIKALSERARKGAQSRKLSAIMSECLGAEAPELRMLAVRGISGNINPVAIKDLTAALQKERNDDVKAEIIRALNSSSNPGIAATCMGILNDPAAGPELRKVAVEELGKNPDGIKAARVLAVMLDSEGGIEAQAAEEALKKLYRVNPVLIAGTVSRIGMNNEPDSAVRAASAILSDFADPATLTALTGMLKHSDPEVRKNASYALYRIGKNCDVRIIPELTRLVTSETEPLEVRINAVRTIGVIGVYTDDSADILLTTAKMKGGKYSILRGFALESLGRIGIKETEMLDTVSTIALREREAYIQKTALEAVSKAGLSSGKTQENLARLFGKTDEDEIKITILEILSRSGASIADELAENLEISALEPDLQLRAVYSLACCGMEKAYSRMMDIASGSEGLSDSAAESAAVLLEDGNRAVLGELVRKRMRSEDNEEMISFLEDLESGLTASF